MGVLENPLDRSHQTKISAFIHEVHALQHHVDSQIRTLKDLRDQLCSDRGKLSHDQDPAYTSPQQALLRQCLSTLKEKSESFDELLDKAKSLLKAVRPFFLHLGFRYDETVLNKGLEHRVNLDEQGPPGHGNLHLYSCDSHIPSLIYSNQLSGYEHE